MRRPSLILGMLVLALAAMLAGCNLPGQSSSASVNGSSTTAPAPTPAATPTLPIGDYAFLRDGDIWAHTGGAPSHAITQLHLSAVNALWGMPVWSADHKTLAFALNAPPLAPGYPKLGQPAPDPAQDTGTLFTVDVNSGKLTAITASNGSVPLLGQHIAWYTDSSNTAHLLFTLAGTVYEIQPGAANAAATTLSGLQNVWEIAVRGNTLFYSSVIDISSTGNGFAQLHAYDLVTKKDRLVVALGPVTLPPAACNGLICLPDKNTPAVPYPWAVSADGAVIVYAQGPQEAGPVPRPNQTPTPTPTTKPHVATAAPPTPAPTATPGATQIIGFFAVAGTTKPKQIFQDITLPAKETQFRLGISPNGQMAALSVGDQKNIPFGPYLQTLAHGTPLNVGSNGPAVATGTPMWSPDNVGFVLTTAPATGTMQTPSLTVYYPSDQVAQLELNGSDMAWGM